MTDMGTLRVKLELDGLDALSNFLTYVRSLAMQGLAPDLPTVLETCKSIVSCRVVR